MSAEITVAELAQKLDLVHLVDVRELDEYVEGHVPGALFAPLSELGDMVHQFRTDAPNYVICRSGGRSARACQWLAAQGIEAINVAGGTLAWVEAGNGVVAGDQPA
jgi:rhodanese-related sulfurtransferase